MSLSYGLVGASPLWALALGLFSSWSHSCAHPPQPLSLGVPATARSCRTGEAQGPISTAPRAGSQGAEETLRLISAVPPLQLLLALVLPGPAHPAVRLALELEGHGHTVELAPTHLGFVSLLWEEG